MKDKLSIEVIDKKGNRQLYEQINREKDLLTKKSENILQPVIR